MATLCIPTSKIQGDDYINDYIALWATKVSKFWGIGQPALRSYASLRTTWQSSRRICMYITMSPTPSKLLIINYSREQYHEWCYQYCLLWLQAANTDEYFAATDHWIEEKTLTVWEYKSMLLGFTEINNAHNGKRLGGALFKLFEYVSMAHKVISFLFLLFHCYCYCQLLISFFS